MMDRVRKNATLAGLFFFFASALVPFFDSASESDAVVSAVKPFTKPMLGDMTGMTVGLLGLSYLIATLIFYWLAWKNHKRAILTLVLVYVFQLLPMLVEWSLEVQLGITNYLGSLSCLADGVILCCLIMARQDKASSAQT